MQTDALLNFLSGLYQSGRLEDKNDSALNYAILALSVAGSAKNLANVIFLLNKAGRQGEAIRVFETFKPVDSSDEDMAILHYNYACLLMELGKLTRAAAQFREARRLNPKCPMTRYQLSNVLMALGEYKEGLEEDQYRFEAHSQLKRFRRRFQAPDWDGKSLERVLVFSEQGLGDAILCARYLKNLKEAGCSVILEIQSELADLFRSRPDTYLDTWVDEVYARESTDYVGQVVPPERYDSVVSINSLPLHFDPELTSPPTFQYLEVPGEFSMAIRTSLKVGLVWAGSRFHSNDRDRSCFLKHLAPLFDIPRVSLLNFQQGDLVRTWCKPGSTLWDGDENYDVVDLNEDAGDLLKQMPNVVFECPTFFHTAKQLAQLDLLITVDTAVAHLAGAMGISTWLMLPYAHEWRWRRSWYTSVSYYRQPSQGDWPGLVSQIVDDLRQKVLDLLGKK